MKVAGLNTMVLRISSQIISHSFEIAQPGYVTPHLKR